MDALEDSRRAVTGASMAGALASETPTPPALVEAEEDEARTATPAAATDQGVVREAAVAVRQSTLPTELIDHILSFIPTKYFWADGVLARCCLVSRTFLALARPRLYAYLCFDFDLYDENCNIEIGITADLPDYRLYRCLLSNPHLARLVKTVRLRTSLNYYAGVPISWGQPFDHLSESEDEDAEERLNELHERFFAAHAIDTVLLLSILPNLASVTIDPEDINGCVPEDADQEERWRQYLHRAYLPSLTSLDVPFFPERISRYFPSLVHLSCVVDSKMRPLDTPLPHRLQSISFSNPPPPEPLSLLSMLWTEDCHPSLSAFTVLRTLVIRLDSSFTLDTLSALAFPLFALPPSLEDLEVGSDEPCWDKDNENDTRFKNTFLGHLPRRLRRLSLTYTVFTETMLTAFIKAKDTAAPQLEVLAMRSSESGWQPWGYVGGMLIESWCKEKGVVYRS
ncbi:hypothetical protein JCM10213_003804 [Rhodosporidiobolus nylandii]